MRRKGANYGSSVDILGLTDVVGDNAASVKDDKNITAIKMNFTTKSVFKFWSFFNSKQIIELNN